METVVPQPSTFGTCVLIVPQDYSTHTQATLVYIKVLRFSRNTVTTLISEETREITITTRTVVTVRVFLGTPTGTLPENILILESIVRKEGGGVKMTVQSP